MKKKKKKKTETLFTLFWVVIYITSEFNFIKKKNRNFTDAILT